MKRLYRSSRDRKIAGILGGLGEVLDVDPTILRIACIFLGLITVVLPFVVTYLIAWWLIPEDRELPRSGP